MPAEPAAPARPRHTSWAILALLATLPAAALLAHLGLLRTTIPIPARQLSEANGMLRVKKPFLQEHGPTDPPHLTLLWHGRPLPRLPYSQDLALAPGPAFWGKDHVLYIKPATEGQAPAGGLALRRPWRVPPALWWAWGLLSTTALLAAWHGRLLPALLEETTTAWRRLDRALTAVQHRTAWHATLAGLTVLIIATRYADKVATPYLVAEDATVFLADSLEHGAAALTMPYAGYLHALPRLGAWLASPLPLEHFPAAQLTFSLGIMGLVMFCIARWLMGWREQLTAIAFICLAPLGGYLMLSLTNLQWFTAIALALLAVHPGPAPATRPGRIALLLVATLMALTGPFAIVTLPFFLLGAVLQRTPFTLTLAATQLAAGALQLALVATHRPPPEQVPDPATAPVLSWLADFAHGLPGTAAWLETLTPSGRLMLGLGLAAVLLAGALHRLRREGFTSRYLQLLALATLFAAAGWLRTDGLSKPWLAGDRYYVVPYTLLLLCLATLWQSAPRPLRAAALLTLLVCLLGYRASPLPRLEVPSWHDQLARIPPGGSAHVKTWPSHGNWSVFLARDANGHWLRGQPYRQLLPPR